MRLFQLAQIWFGLLQFTQMYTIYANLNEPLELYPDLSNSTQVGMKLFQLSKLYWVCWNYSNVSNSVQMWMCITQTGMKLFHFAQIWMELLLFAEILFSVLEFTKLFQFIEMFLISCKLEWSCSNLLKFDWGCWNLPKLFQFYLSLIKALIVHLDVSNCIRISMALFYIAQLWI